MSNKSLKNPFILSDDPSHQKLLKRNNAEKRFRLYGLLSIMTSVVFLGFLLFTIFSNGLSSFWQTKIKLDIDLKSYIENVGSPEEIRKNLEKVNYRKELNKSLKGLYPEAKRRKDVIQLYSSISRNSHVDVKKKVLNAKTDDLLQENGAYIISVWVPASSEIDMYMKGKIDAEVEQSRRRISDFTLKLVDKLKLKQRIEKTFNYSFFSKGDSREPEVAGIWGSLKGSMIVIFLCVLMSLPLGVAAAIYLEEFATESKLKNITEISINNLAAVPSIVFGLLGLAIYINFFGVERSSALVGGLTLALLVLPVIIVSARNAIAAVPPSIKDAATGLGASKVQVVFHHTIPLALPGIMTGSILSLARALGETAPLLMIGMVAFIKDIPQTVNDPTTVLPVQIYIWSDLPEVGFAEKTSGAIIILILFLILANSLAVYLRKRFEYKW